MSTVNEPIRPDGIEYWVEDHPPFYLSLMLAVQQVAFLGAIMTLPVVLGRQAGLGLAGEASLVALTMVGAGIGVMLQALNRYGIGIGLFSPMHTSSAAFPAALMAVKTGGLGLAFGMMSVVGLVQIGASRLVPRLRSLFPVEIAGLIVLILGLGLGLVGIHNFLAIDTPMQGTAEAFGAGFLTLAVIIGLNIWTRGHWHAFSVFIGLVVGQVFSILTGLVSAQKLSTFTEVPLFAVPQIGQFGWAFDWTLLPHFIIVGLALSFNCFGVLTVAQRANDAGWKRPDMKGIGHGLMAEGLTNMVCSLVNGVTQTASGGAIGLAQASGITSRIVAFVLGGLFIVLAFFPPVAMLWASLADPVIGAVLMFVGSFIMIGGIRIITSRLLDNRKIITLGLATIVGLSHNEVLTQLISEKTPTFLEPVLASTLSVTVLIAVLLNALFRLGSDRKLSHCIELNEQWSGSVNRVIWHLGHQWNARPEVVQRVDHITHELLYVLTSYDLIKGEPKLHLTALFDEYRCQLRVSYNGEPLQVIKQRPDPESLIDDPNAVLAVAGYLIHRLADAVKVDARNGQCIVTLTFND